MKPSELETDAVRRKAERIARGRRERRSAWQNLAHVGTLGWVLVIPLVLGIFVGRLAAIATGTRAPTLVGLFVGLAAGAYAVWRQLRRSLRDEEDEP